MEFKGCSAGSLAAKNDDGTQGNFLPACDFSLQTFTHRARFYPASVAFQNSLVGKASKTFSFQHVRLMEPNIPAMLDRDAGLSASVLFSEHPGCKSKQDFLSFARPANTTQNTSIVGARPGRKRASPIIRLRSEGLPTRGPFPLWPIPANSSHRLTWMRIWNYRV